MQKGQLKDAGSMRYQIDDFETKITEEELEEESERMHPPRMRSQRQ